MHVVFVHVHVKTDCVNDFRAAILENARGSLKESGVVRFDVFQQVEDPTRFTLVEVYLSADDQLKHRETAHYIKWRDSVGEMMAEPRQGIRYALLSPD